MTIRIQFYFWFINLKRYFFSSFLYIFLIMLASIDRTLYTKNGFICNITNSLHNCSNLRRSHTIYRSRLYKFLPKRNILVRLSHTAASDEKHTFLFFPLLPASVAAYYIRQMSFHHCTSNICKFPSNDC